MKPSDNKKRLFLDMQQHPENYSDEQMEAMMAELDEPVDVEACWEEFCKKTVPNHVQTKSRKKNNLLWWSSIAAAVIVLYAAWEVIQLNVHDEVQEPSTNIASNENIDNNNVVAQNTITDKNVLENQRIYETIGSEKSEKEARSDNSNAEEITTSGQAENEAVAVTLTDGKEQQHADILNPEGKDETIFSNCTETYPSFKGGEWGLKEFIRENLRYPTDFPDSTITGRVAISFIVKRDGNLEDFKMTRSILKYTDGTDCKDSTIINIFAEEALRVCRLMPKWRPAVRCIDNTFQRVDWKYTIHFRFAEEKGIKIR